MDRPDATMPALTGNRDRDWDWDAFAAVYQKVTSQVPASPAQRQELAAATMTAMIASLHDNHAGWSYPAPPPGSVPGDLGIMTSPSYPLANIAPQEALPPLFVTAVEPGSPADSHGVQAGDVIVSVNGAPPFPGGIVSEGVMNLLFGPYPQAGRVSVQLHRPATGRTWTVILTPAFNQAPPSPGVSRMLLNGHIAYVQLTGFFPGSADVVLQAFSGLAAGAKLRGLILDLRSNRGGTAADPARLLGAFIHGAAWSYDCDVHGSCAARYTDSSVPLLHLPLVVLTDRICVSAPWSAPGPRASSPAPRPVTCSMTAACLAFRQSTRWAPTTRSSTASASRPTTTSRSLHKTCPPDTTPTSPRHSLCSAANPHQPDVTEAADPTGSVQAVRQSPCH